MGDKLLEKLEKVIGDGDLDMKKMLGKSQQNDIFSKKYWIQHNKIKGLEKIADELEGKTK